MFKLFAFILLVVAVKISGEVASFCDDSAGSYIAMLDRSMSLINFEYPLWADGFDSVYWFSIADHCMQLVTGDAYRNLMYGILEYGEYTQNFCRRRCEHYIEARTVQCAPRRSSPQWVVGIENTPPPLEQMNCSNWDIPLTNKGKIDGISLSFRIQTQGIGNRPIILDNESTIYLSSLPIHYLIVVLEGKPSEGQKVVEQLKNFIELNPEITQIAFGGAIEGSRIKMSGFNAVLQTLPQIDTIFYQKIDSQELNNPPHADVTSLRAISFNDVGGIGGIPKWVEEATGLQMLQLMNFLDDSYEITVLDNLPNLEHFHLIGTSLTKIKQPFLAKSTKLISLTIKFNAISSIQEGAFDHLTELRFITISGNEMNTIPQNLLYNMPNLINIDLKSCSGDSLYGFDLYRYKGCPSQSKAISILPAIRNPDQVMSLELSGMTEAAKNITQFGNYLEQFTNLELLNLDTTNLQSLDGLNLHKLCNLLYLNLAANQFTNDDWFPEIVYHKLKLEQLHVIYSEINKLTAPFLAMIRSSPRMLYDINVELPLSGGKATTDDCQKDALNTVTMFNYATKNDKCAKEINQIKSDIQNLDQIRSKSTC